jgi:hypothetical protein
LEVQVANQADSKTTSDRRLQMILMTIFPFDAAVARALRRRADNCRGSRGSGECDTEAHKRQGANRRSGYDEFL